MHIVLVVNVHSRRVRRELPRLRALFQDRGVSCEGPLEVHGSPALRRILRRAVKRGVDAVVVGGGDGSMTCAANALAHCKTPLGVLPLGTGNSFAQTLGVGTDLETAVNVIARGRIAQVDLGVVNGTYFANFATIGFPAEVAAAAPAGLKRVFGPLTYVIGAVKPFLTHRAFDARMRWEGGEMRFHTQQVVVASGRFYGFQPLTPDATITDRKLAVFTTTGVSHADIVRTYLAFARGEHAELPDAHLFAAERLVVRARPRQLISIDGEKLGPTPAHFTIAGGALRVFVPETFPDVGR